MEQFLRKFQNSGKITWTRVKRSNGKYGYVRTKNERPVDFDEYTGKFKMYDLPDTNSNWLEVSKPGTSSSNIKSIERRPDSHADYITQQKMVDAKGNIWYEVDVPKGYLSKEWQFKQEEK